MAHDSEYAGFSRYEKRWFIIGAVLLMALLAVMWYFTMANRQIIPGYTTSVEPKQILDRPMFQHPGVSKVGPGHYRVAMTAQDFSFTPSKVTVPADAKISFVLTSRDVVHGFQIPGGLVNVEVIPGRIARVSHTFHRPGTYRFDCNQYCGVGHPFMTGDLVVVPAGQYHPGGGKATAQNGGASATARGKQIYDSHCAACHQKNGSGLAGAFPPLAGHLPQFAATPAGRKYLLAAVLFGVDGKIEAKGKDYNGHMPDWKGTLDDAQVAQVLDYALTAWGNRKQLPKSYAPYTATEAAAVRKLGLTPAQVYARREKLDLEH